ncbi:hypothetical protein KY290_000718 [Solanum tuberosum]|nr:hypothetical protein KY290_000718 [Solanum tuberosum]
MKLMMMEKEKKGTKKKYRKKKAWAFKAIPHLRHQVTAEEEISSPRILRWLRAKNVKKDWIGAKRILAVMNLNKTHFLTLEILLHEGHMNVYDYSLMGMEHAKFLTFIQYVFELLPKLLKQSGIMKHLPDKFFNEPWEFEGRLEPMVTNDTKAACDSYSLAFIEHLITRTTIQPPQTLLCDNIVGRMQWIWAAGIVSRSLEL